MKTKTKAITLLLLTLIILKLLYGTPTMYVWVSFLGNDFAFAHALYFCVLFKYVQFLFEKEARRDFLV